MKKLKDKKRIYNQLSLYPFLYPKHNETIEYSGNSYCINLIPLMPTKGFFASLLDCHDQLFALGLVNSLNDSDRIIIFPGTTYPAGAGFWSQIIADFFPFMMIGKVLFNCAKDRINKFIQNKNNVVAVGTVQKSVSEIEQKKV